MNPKARTIALVVIFVAALLLTITVETVGTSTVTHRRADTMRAAEQLTERWFGLIGELKAERGLVNHEAHVPYGYMIGDDYTPITTTLGSLNAKETAANPQFSALMVRLLTDAGIDSASTVGVTMSASFPTLAIASLAALQSIGCRVVLLSSLGASTFGANQPEATWLDMESKLRGDGGLIYRSELVTPGAEYDRGEGLLDEGPAIMQDAATRNGYELIYPTSLAASIESKTKLLRQNKIDLLINIGGNEAALGSCAHAVSLPNGFHDNYRPCSCPDRGIIAHLAGQGVPFIHLLYIRDLAIRYGVALDAPPNGAGGDRLYQARYASPIMVAGCLIVMLALLLGYRKINTTRDDER